MCASCLSSSTACTRLAVVVPPDQLLPDDFSLHGGLPREGIRLTVAAGRRLLVEPRLAILYEYRPWLEPLLQRLDRRGLSFDPIPIRRMVIDPGTRAYPYDLVVNRISAYPGGTGNPRMVFTALEYLHRLESRGVRVLNGYQSFCIATSKLRQVGILADLGLKFPRTRALHRGRQLPEAAAALTPPLIFKPNVGGSGVAIRVLQSMDDVCSAARDYTLDLGADGVGVLQEYHRPWGEHIVRVEMLNGRLLYATRQRVTPRAFNYCAIGGQNVSRDSHAIEVVRPPPEVVDEVTQIMQRVGARFGSVEYLVSERDGERYYFDINPFSNYVSAEVLGFDPLDRLAEFIEEQVMKRSSTLSVPHV